MSRTLHFWNTMLSYLRRSRRKAGSKCRNLPAISGIGGVVQAAVEPLEGRRLLSVAATPVLKLLDPPPTAGDELGYSVAASEQFYVLGIPFSNSLGTDSGAVVV